MLELNSYLTPYYNYKPRWQKPPLFYWLVAASYKIFGISESSARIPSILSSLLTALFILFMCLKHGGGESAPLIFLSMPYIFTISHLSITDPLLCFFITVSNYSLFTFLMGGSIWWRRIAYISMAFGTLTKGPVAFLIPLLSNMIFLAVTKRYQLLKNMASYKDVLLFLTISLPWYIYLYIHVGSSFFIKETFGRFFKGAYHKEGFFFFIPYLFLGSFPYFLLINFKEKSPLFQYSITTSIFIFLFFSISSCKLPSYILPMFPPLAISLSYTDKKDLLRKALIFSICLFSFTKLLLLPTYGGRLSIKPLFEGKKFPREATFLFFKKPYKAYPFYVRKKVYKIRSWEEIKRYSGEIFILTSERFINELKKEKLILVSKTKFKKKNLFLFKVTL